MSENLPRCQCGAEGFLINKQALKSWKVACTSTRCGSSTAQFPEKQDAIRAWGKQSDAQG